MGDMKNAGFLIQRWMNVRKMWEVFLIDYYQVHKIIMYFIKVFDWFPNLLLCYYQT